MRIVKKPRGCGMNRLLRLKAELSSLPDFMPFRVQTKLMPFGYKGKLGQGGAAMMVVILIAVSVALMAVAALAIAPQLKRIQAERKTVKRADVIVKAARQYYLARHELPTPTPAPNGMPVVELGLSQEYRLDSWGREWRYWRATTTGTQTDPFDLNDKMTYGGRQIAGVLISNGPDQQSNSSVALVSGRLEVTKGGDDLVFPINVQGEAIQIAKDELKRLIADGMIRF